MKLFISVVSHLHQNLLINLGSIRQLALRDSIEVVCRDNIPTQPLEKACELYGVHYIPCTEPKGFSENHNQNFLYCERELGMQSDDFFIVFNPDIYILDSIIDKLLIQLESTPEDFLVPNLLLDKEGFMHDDNIRKYPKFSDFIRTYALNQRATMVDRSNGLENTKQYWASGACLIVRSELYKQAKGLDEKYYMYCEDIDFSARLNSKGITFRYLEDITMVHLRRRYSKRLFSMHFWWHVASVLKYSFSSRAFEASRSVLKLEDKR